MKKGIRVFVVEVSLLMFMSISLFSQQEEEKKPLNWGIEYDLMAPRIGQWHSVNLSGWVGFGRIKHSLVFAKININNNHLTEESFEKDDFTVIGYRGEFCFGKNLKGFSTGITMLYSMNNVVTSLHQQSGKFNTILLGLPLGYTWVLWHHLTINPNLSILVPLTHKTVKIGTDEVSQAPWGLEPGLKIGYRF